MAGKLLHLIRGKEAERTAAKYLHGKGYKVIDQNRSYRFGEIDMIAQRAEQRVFVEVKFRNDIQRGNAAEFVDFHKQRRLTKCALRWIQEHDPNMNFAYRFDVIAIEGLDKKQKISWITNAFEGDFLC